MQCIIGRGTTFKVGGERKGSAVGRETGEENMQEEFVCGWCGTNLHYTKYVWGGCHVFQHDRVKAVVNL